MSLEDERIRFYFRHREQIEQWASLRSEAAAAVDEWMPQLALDIEQLASTLAPDVQVRAVVGAEQSYPSFRLTRRAWGFGDVDDPPASVSLEWLRARTTMRGSFTPYVGLRSARTHSLGVALRASESLRQARLVRKDATSLWLVAFSYVAPPPEFPVVLDGYRDALLDAIRGAWNAYAPHVPVSAA